MTYHSQTRLDRVMTHEQFTQVVEAILAGKYSWACVLILRFAGYNPLHYIPYRTYNRLEKENQPRKKHHPQPETHSQTLHSHSSNSLSIREHLAEIEELSDLETLSEQTKLRGGNGWRDSHGLWSAVYRVR